MRAFSEHEWAVILGGSSGFGLASARKLGREGLSVCVVHRDRRGAMERINREFEDIRAHAAGFFSLNLDALSPEGIATTLESLREQLGAEGRVRLLLHSIAFGNLKPVVAAPARTAAQPPIDALAAALGLPTADVERAFARLADSGDPLAQAVQPVDYGDAVLEE